MRLIAVFMLVGCLSAFAQKKNAISLLDKLTPGDTLFIYQCMVIDPPQEGLVADYADPGKDKTITRTIRCVVTKTTTGFYSRWYGTDIIDYPNRKFSGLKIKERPYWLFKEEHNMPLDSAALQMIRRMEKGGREAIEFDYPITKYTRNQVIFRLGADFKQLVLDKGPALTSIYRRPN